MATDTNKMMQLIKERTGTAPIESPAAESVMLGDDGEVLLKLAVSVQKDVITRACCYAAKDIPVDVAAALAQTTLLVDSKAVMAAALVDSKAIEASLSTDGSVDECNKAAVGIAALMLSECLRNYSAKYNAARDERLKKKEQST